MGKFNEYTEKVTPDDVDIFLLQDASATKKTTFLSIFNQIKTKLGLGLLATKSKISEEELETALLNLINGKLTASGMANDLITTDATKALAAPQGKKLLEYIGTLTQLTTVEKANLVGAINELVTSVDSLNRNLQINQFTIVSGNTSYFGGNNFAYNLPDGAYMLNLRITILAGISAGNDTTTLTGLPFAWKYDMFIPGCLNNGKSIILRCAANEIGIRLGTEHEALAQGMAISAAIVIPPQFIK